MFSFRCGGFGCWSLLIVLIFAFYWCGLKRYYGLFSGGLRVCCFRVVSCLWFRSGLWLLVCLVFCGIVCGL